MQSTLQDVIRVNDCLLNIALTSGARWPAKSDQGTLQPISLSVDISHDVAPASISDDINLSINYSSISKQLGAALMDSGSVTYGSLKDVADRAFLVLQDVLKATSVAEVKIKIIQIKAPLHCKEVGLEAWAYRMKGAWVVSRVRHFITDFTCPAIIGVNDVERVEEQEVVVNISVETHTIHHDRTILDFQRLTKSLWEGIGKSSYLTLEALTTYTARETLASLSQDFGANANPSVTVAVAKPCALVHADSSEVQITRTFDDFSRPKRSETHTAVLALGSNMGDRFFNIEYALRLIEQPGQFVSEADLCPLPQIFVVDTSFLYETAPMYVTDQPAFINGACVIETNLEPQGLLRLLKAIELAVGRIPMIRNGPRVVDLDIIFYDDLVLDTRPVSQRTVLENIMGELVIPHPRLHEREFVLRPLNDMIPGYFHPVLGRSVAHLLKNVSRNNEDPPMFKVLPFPKLPYKPVFGDCKPPPTLTYWVHPSPMTSLGPMSTPSRQSRTRLMATLNVTPDSFSDGSVHNTMPTALVYVNESVASGADIIDIGGYSTRPGATFVDVDEEIRRVIPIIREIRSSASPNEVCTVPISVDTFRWEVAEAAILEGANVINDVYAFTGPKSDPGTWQQDAGALYTMDKMKQLARQNATPVVLMHSRGDAGQNQDYSAYAYAEQAGGVHSVIEGVRVELGDKIDRIVRRKGGLRRWLLIADPGIGFSKSIADNLELLRNGRKVVEDIKIGQGELRRRNPLTGFPTLVGTSRKGFIGAILSTAEKGRETSARERIWATAAGVTCAVQQGAMVTRVHDVKEMYDVVIMAGALWP